MFRIDGNGNDPYGLFKKGKTEHTETPAVSKPDVPMVESKQLDAGKKLTLDEEKGLYSSMGVNISKVSAEDIKELDQLTKLARTQLNLPKLETPYLTKACYAQYEQAAQAFTETIAADFGQNHPEKNIRALALRPEMAMLDELAGLDKNLGSEAALRTFEQEAWSEGPWSYV